MISVLPQLRWHRIHGRAYGAYLVLGFNLPGKIPKCSGLSFPAIIGHHDDGSPYLALLITLNPHDDDVIDVLPLLPGKVKELVGAATSGSDYHQVPRIYIGKKILERAPLLHPPRNYTVPYPCTFDTIRVSERTIAVLYLPIKETSDGEDE